MNQVILRGRMTADVETHLGKDGKIGVALFTLAVPDRSMPKDKDGQFPVDFIRHCTFGVNAEVLKKYALKGTELLVFGRFKTGSYEKDGVKHFSSEVLVDKFEFISGTKGDKKAQEENKES